MCPRSDQPSNDPNELNWTSRSKDDHTRQNPRLGPTMGWTKPVHDETSKGERFEGDKVDQQGGSLDVCSSHKKSGENTIQEGTQMMGNHKGSWIGKARGNLHDVHDNND